MTYILKEIVPVPSDKAEVVATSGDDEYGAVVSRNELRDFLGAAFPHSNLRDTVPAQIAKGVAYTGPGVQITEEAASNLKWKKKA
jgi:hypothetical protein